MRAQATILVSLVVPTASYKKKVPLRPTGDRRRKLLIQALGMAVREMGDNGLLQGQDHVVVRPIADAEHSPFKTCASCLQYQALRRHKSSLEQVRVHSVTLQRSAWFH